MKLLSTCKNVTNCPGIDRPQECTSNQKWCICTMPNFECFEGILEKSASYTDQYSNINDCVNLCNSDDNCTASTFVYDSVYSEAKICLTFSSCISLRKVSGYDMLGKITYKKNCWIEWIILQNHSTDHFKVGLL